MCERNSNDLGYIHRKEDPVLIPDSGGRRGVMRMRVGNRIRFCTMLLIGLAALTLAGGVAKEANWKLGATAKAPPQTPANPPPIPAAGPLAEPKSLKQVGGPVEALVRRFQRTIRRHLRKSHSAKSFFSTVACRLMEPLLAVPATTRRALSPTEDPPRSASKAASANATRRQF